MEGQGDDPASAGVCSYKKFTSVHKKLVYRCGAQEADSLSLSLSLFLPHQLADLEVRLGESQKSGEGLRSKLAEALATCRSKDEEILK